MNLEDYPTPLTDDVDLMDSRLEGYHDSHKYDRMHSLAKRLERKLAAMTRERDALQGALEHPEDERHQCRFRRQRDEALRRLTMYRDALEKQACLTAYYNGHSDGYKQHPDGGTYWENYLCPEARAAITATEPKP